MGNTSSSAKNSAANNSTQSPSRSSRRSRSAAPPDPPPIQSPPPSHAPSPPTQRQLLPHRSLRHKKKSIELPDLASLAITPGSSQNSSPHGSHRRPLPSSPIAIPQRSGNQPAPSSPRLRTIPTEQQPLVEAIYQPPSIPAYGSRGRGNPHIRGAPLQYNSTRSFAGRGNHPQQQQPTQPFATRGKPFIPEDVRSTIPLALRQAEVQQAEAESEAGPSVVEDHSADEKEPASVCIVWRGGGTIVELIRAGDANWKGRQQMDYEYVCLTLSSHLYPDLFAASH